MKPLLLWSNHGPMQLIQVMYGLLADKRLIDGLGRPKEFSLHLPHRYGVVSSQEQDPLHHLRGGAIDNAAAWPREIR